MKVPFIKGDDEKQNKRNGKKQMPHKKCPPAASENYEKQMKTYIN